MMKSKNSWPEPPTPNLSELAQPLIRHAHRLDDAHHAARSVDALLERIGQSRLVLLGEASHGTREFYEFRARLTQRLIREKGFRIVAVEADWPDMQRVNRYLRSGSGGTGEVGEQRGGPDAMGGPGNLPVDATAQEALGDFVRFPQWMWRNEVVAAFVEWLRDFNANSEPGAGPAGIYGLDLYSLHASMEAVVAFLEKIDPAAAGRARARYACFDSFGGGDPQVYGLSALQGLGSCENAVVEQLVELRKKAQEFVLKGGEFAREDAFVAEQNARLVKDAEEYYRAIFGEGSASWNLRDRHMMATLEALLLHHEDSRAVVWAHNSHLGDARATEMAVRGELNLGQLVRERFGRECFNIGFTTFSGTVTAARDWNAPAQRRQVRPALEESYEALLHEVGEGFWLDLAQSGDVNRVLQKPRLERAIGVIYRPENERRSHYFYSILPEQFDALIHLDHTHALRPLERTTHWDHAELPETWPSAL